MVRARSQTYSAPVAAIAALTEPWRAESKRGRFATDGETSTIDSRNLLDQEAPIRYSSQDPPCCCRLEGSTEARDVSNVDPPSERCGPPAYATTEMLSEPWRFFPSLGGAEEADGDNDENEYHEGAFKISKGPDVREFSEADLGPSLCQRSRRAFLLIAIFASVSSGVMVGLYTYATSFERALGIGSANPEEQIFLGTVSSEPDFIKYLGSFCFRGMHDKGNSVGELMIRVRKESPGPWPFEAQLDFAVFDDQAASWPAVHWQRDSQSRSKWGNILTHAKSITHLKRRMTDGHRESGNVVVISERYRRHWLGVLVGTGFNETQDVQIDYKMQGVQATSKTGPEDIHPELQDCPPSSLQDMVKNAIFDYAS